MDKQEEREERNKAVLFPLVDSSKQKDIMSCWDVVHNVRRRNLAWTS